MTTATRGRRGPPTPSPGKPGSPGVRPGPLSRAESVGRGLLVAASPEPPEPPPPPPTPPPPEPPASPGPSGAGRIDTTGSVAVTPEVGKTSESAQLDMYQTVP